MHLSMFERDEGLLSLGVVVNGCAAGGTAASSRG